MPHSYWKTSTTGNSVSHINCVQLCRDIPPPQVYVFVQWTITHQASLSACMCSCMTSVCTCLAVTGQQTWKLGQWQSAGRERKSSSDTLSTCESTTTGLLWSRSSWLTTVCGVGWGCSAHWETGMTERWRNLGCVSSCIYQKISRGFTSEIRPPRSSCIWKYVKADEHSYSTHKHAYINDLWYAQVMTVILSDRFRSSLLRLSVILVDPLLSYCTTAVLKPGTVCVLMHICVCMCEGENEREGGS